MSSSSSEERPLRSQITFTTSQRGGQVLNLLNHQYLLQKRSDCSRTEYWKCRHSKCSARVNLFVNGEVTFTGQHLEGEGGERKKSEVEKITRRIKKLAETQLNLTTQEVLDSVLREVPLSVMEQLPVKDSLKRKIRYWRASVSNKPGGGTGGGKVEGEGEKMEGEGERVEFKLEPEDNDNYLEQFEQDDNDNFEDMEGYLPQVPDLKDSTSSKPCIICYKPNNVKKRSNNDLSGRKGKDKLKLFFKLFGRHVDIEGSGGRGGATSWERNLQNLNEFIETGFVACGNCSELVNSFLQLYHQIHSLQLRLNWNVRKIKKVISKAGMVPQRIKYFRAKTNSTKKKGLNPEEITKLKGNLVKKCGVKLKKTFPRLTLRKCDGDNKAYHHHRSSEHLSTATASLTYLVVPKQEPELEQVPIDSEEIEGDLGFDFDDYDDGALPLPSSSSPVGPESEPEPEVAVAEETEPEPNSDLIESNLEKYNRLRRKRTRKRASNSNKPDLQPGETKLVSVSPSKPELFLKDPSTNRFQCPSCPKKHASLRHCQDHYDYHHLGIKQTCPDCGMTFARADYLQYHRQSVHLGQPKIFKCDKCGMCFKGARKYLTKHQAFRCKYSLPAQKKIEERLQSRTCPTCGKIFREPRNMRNHVNAVHLKLKEHICEQCGAAFGDASSLRIHKKHVHLKIKNHFCDQCGASCPNSHALMKHVEMVHLKLRNVKCDYEGCGQSFYNTSNLNDHVKYVHLKVKELACDMCDLRFSRKHHLQVHRNSVHLKIKGECELCGKQVRVGSLDKHQKYYCPANDNKLKDGSLCRICGKEFHTRGRQRLREHLRKVHPEITEQEVAEAVAGSSRVGQEDDNKNGEVRTGTFAMH